MMTCRELAQLLIDFVADELAGEHRALVEEHLSCCPPCVTYLETYKLTIQLTRQLPAGPMPDGLCERLMVAWTQIQTKGCSDEGESPPDS
jgi:anti-sigma factor RsiW